MSYYRFACRCVLSGTVLAAAFAGCARQPVKPTAAGPPAIAPTASTAPPSSVAPWLAATGLVDLRPGPVVQFQAACARCHGRQGSLFDPSLARLDLHELRREVFEMMAGPGQLRPSQGQFEAMTAYVQAIRQGKPFVVVDNAASFTTDQTLALQGEVTPGATVEVRANQHVVRALVQDTTWMLPNPPAMPFSVVATVAGKQARFPFPLQQWSAVPEPTVPSTQERAIMPFPSPD
jgi:mono/diheme cytochrome c family protein